MRSTGWRVSVRLNNVRFQNAFAFTTARAGMWHVKAPLSLIIFFSLDRPRFWRLLNLFDLGLAERLGARAQTAGNFRRNSFACGNQSLPPLFLLLFQWCLNTIYRLRSRAAVRLSRPLVQPWIWHLRSHFSSHCLSESFKQWVSHATAVAPSADPYCSTTYARHK